MESNKEDTVRSNFVTIRRTLQALFGREEGERLVVMVDSCGVFGVVSNEAANTLKIVYNYYCFLRSSSTQRHRCSVGPGFESCCSKGSTEGNTARARWFSGRVIVYGV